MLDTDAVINNSSQKVGGSGRRKTHRIYAPALTHSLTPTDLAATSPRTASAVGCQRDTARIGACSTERPLHGTILPTVFSSKPSARRCWSISRTDRQTDRRTHARRSDYISHKISTTFAPSPGHVWLESALHLKEVVKEFRQKIAGGRPSMPLPLGRGYLSPLPNTWFPGLT